MAIRVAMERYSALGWSYGVQGRLLRKQLEPESGPWKTAHTHGDSCSG